MLRRYTWDKVKDKCQHYKRRKPDQSELYRLVYHCRDKLEFLWEEHYQRTYGVLRDEVLKALDEYLNCGLLEHGAVRVYCDSCKHSLLVAFSCKRRGICPSCGTKRAINFAEHLHGSVLEDVPHRHVVFSLPKRLRPFFRYDRSLSGILFKSAWRSINETLSGGGERAALILTLQTAGEALNWNPHLHGLLADGKFGQDGELDHFENIDCEQIQQRFSELVLSEFSKKELIDDGVMSQILSQEYSGFSFWCGDAFDDAESERFVARYVERGPISLEKLAVEDDLVIYTTKDGKAHEFSALDFLALLTSHIPNTYESITCSPLRGHGGDKAAGGSSLMRTVLVSQTRGAGESCREGRAGCFRGGDGGILKQLGTVYQAGVRDQSARVSSL
ncbi:MAG: transposase zinc-binding domain-containing protein [Bdellovibrionales bacterium]|nr:transposase zinc-binding domain-containing protein [Bdellovibrionales bacterium]